MKSGFVAVAGRPNVGKSTLLNALSGGKIAIVSRIPHTTRHRIRGVWNSPDAQLVLVDLPGWQRPVDMLTERMQDRVDGDDRRTTWTLCCSSSTPGSGSAPVTGHRRRAVFALGVPVVIVVNKVDRLKAGHIATQMKAVAALGDFHALHPVSAKTGDGIAELRSDLVSLLPGGAALLPGGGGDRHRRSRRADGRARARAGPAPDQRGGAARAHRRGRRDRRPGVHADLLIETERQKQILVGKGGSVVQGDRPRARPEIEALLGHTIYLELQVKASPEMAAQRDDARAARAASCPAYRGCERLRFYPALL